MIGDHLPGEPGKVMEVKVGRGSAKDMGTVGEIPGNLSGQRKWHTASRVVVLFQSIQRMSQPRRPKCVVCYCTAYCCVHNARTTD